jgi:hypothetical protein
MPPDSALRNDDLTLECRVCGRRFTPSGRRVFCSGACRQTAWRRRHAPPPPPLPARSPRQRIVYQCPECDNRYLGEQYCADCRRFCRRLGVGGLCPTCDEPVACIDLLSEGPEPQPKEVTPV